MMHNTNIVRRQRASRRRADATRADLVYGAALTILHQFDWASSNEGFAYWSGVFDKIMSATISIRSGHSPVRDIQMIQSGHPSTCGCQLCGLYSERARAIRERRELHIRIEGLTAHILREAKKQEPV